MHISIVTCLYMQIHMYFFLEEELYFPSTNACLACLYQNPVHIFKDTWLGLEAGGGGRRERGDDRITTLRDSRAQSHSFEGSTLNSPNHTVLCDP